VENLGEALLSNKLCAEGTAGTLRVAWGHDGDAERARKGCRKDVMGMLKGHDGDAERT